MAFMESKMKKPMLKKTIMALVKILRNVSCPASMAFMAICLSGQSIKAEPIALVSTGSVWRYLDNGSDQGTAWRANLFDDSAWQAGPAQLGYGDGDEATVVSYGSNSDYKFITTYFRKTFYVTNNVALTNLAVRLLRDDGGVVYLNGTEVFRSNMPEGAITNNTLAAVGLSEPEENAFFSCPVNCALLLPGENVVAVEIHQFGYGSSDISFDLELLANSTLGNTVVLLSIPTNSISTGQAFALDAKILGSFSAQARMVLYQDGMMIGNAEPNLAHFVCSNAVSGNHTYVACLEEPVGIVATSAPVTIWFWLGEPGLEGANFPVFVSGSPLILKGVAGITNNLLRLNPAEGGTGGAWFAYKALLSKGFDTRFQFRISQLYGAGADGFAFIIHGAPSPQLGWPGGGLGYGGLANSLAIEFDTFWSDSDPNGNHISVQSMGQTANTFATNASLGWATSIPNLSDGAIHSVRINYDPGTLRVYLDNLTNPVVTVKVDLNRKLALENGRAWVGFTAATGGAREIHDILSWSLVSTTTFPPTITMANPIHGARLPSHDSIVVKATANDSDGTVAQVDFHVNDRWFATCTNSPFQFAWSNLVVGSYVITAKATDDYGVSALSDPVTVSIYQSPLASLVMTDGKTVFPASANITLGAEVCDLDHNINKVEFYAGNTIVGTANKPPYTILWPRVPAGDYALSVHAVDAWLFSVGSAPVMISVVDPPSILVPLASQTVELGDPVTLSVMAAGTPPLRYQWSRNGMNLGEVNGPSLALNHVQLADVGLYTVLVNNLGGTVTNTARLTVASARCQLSSSGAFYGPAGGSGSLGVVAEPAFGWTVVNTQAWITITSEKSGVGNGTVSYQVSANASPNPRQGMISMGGFGGAAFVVKQAGTASWIPSCTRLPNGRFQLSLVGMAGQAYVIETSTNLLTWTPLFTNAPGTGILDFTDTPTPGPRARYYRAFQVAPTSATERAIPAK
jgi:hypothetical protein